MSKVYLTFEDMQNCPAADDVDSADIVLSADGCDGPMRWCPENQDWFPFKQFVLDLSPPQKFMGRRIPLKNQTRMPVTIGDVTVAPDSEAMVSAEAYCRKYSISGPDIIVSARIMGGPDPEMRPNRMYGMDYDFDWVPPAPSPEPEKSPLDKALEDFVAKRKAKREKQIEPGMVGQAPQSERQWHTERALDRAMRRLSFHEQDIHTRLMPYRREE